MLASWEEFSIISMDSGSDNRRAHYLTLETHNQKKELLKMFLEFQLYANLHHHHHRYHHSDSLETGMHLSCAINHY